MEEPRGYRFDSDYVCEQDQAGKEDPATNGLREGEGQPTILKVLSSRRLL